MTATLPASHFKTKKAFSLVEVTIALGITVFAVISVVGLLPVGLGAVNDSKAQMLETQILKQITAQNVVGAFTDTAFKAYYSYDGQTLPTPNGAAFQVEVEDSSNPPVFPGSANAFDLRRSLKSVKVSITDLRTNQTRTHFLWLPQTRI